MKTFCFVFGCLLFMTGIAQSEQQAITVFIIQKTDKGKGVINQFTETHKKDQPVSKTIQVGNELKTVTEMIPVEEQFVRQWTVNDLDILDHQGKAVENEKIWERIKPGVVVFFCEKKAITPAFLKSLSPEAVIVMLKNKKMK
jgi:hypothetical protein